jgi:cell division protein FtsB
MSPLRLKVAFFFALLVLTGYMALVVFGSKGLLELNAMKQELAALKAENKALQEKNLEMHRKIKRMKEDPEFLESIAREKLKMIGKDEIVFKFKEKEDPQ